MTDIELINKVIDKYCYMGSHGTNLRAIDKLSGETYTLSDLLSLLRKLLGSFVSMEIVKNWYEFEGNKIKNTIFDEIEKMDLDRGSYVLGHELARDAKRLKLRVTKDYTDVLFHQYYLERKLTNDHLALFKEFRVALVSRNWEAFWGNQKIDADYLRRLYDESDELIMIKVLDDYNNWKTEAVIDETHRLMNIIG